MTGISQYLVSIGTNLYINFSSKHCNSWTSSSKYLF